MFESLEERVVGYGTDDILKGAAEAVRARVEAENVLLAWTAAWAEANSAASIHPDELKLTGGPRGVRPGGEGTPEVHDLALEVLAVKIKKSDFACSRFVGEVLDLRHRLPLLWEKVMRCEVEGWQARGIARQTHHLSLELARQVDEDLAGAAGVVAQRKLQNLTEAAIARVDGPRLEREAAERKKQLGVWLSQTNDEGLKGLFARLEPPDAVRLFGRIQELADALPPDDRTPDERRAAGLALLANELEATRVLAEYRQPDLFGEEFAAASSRSWVRKTSRSRNPSFIRPCGTSRPRSSTPTTLRPLCSGPRSSRSWPSSIRPGWCRPRPWSCTLPPRRWSQGRGSAGCRGSAPPSRVW
ncbi:DUF222 domain-containing protein [Microlunatus parietis]|uniref:DUF222 domain-containing protein n=1 Tax=Microlunatus parietis TaxID=682979 RepID=A0A7Y9I1W9_9ACTN|nr:hypothetical protein [Microlunatus parietis]NYE68720.1 hypothetical protein [Microlunatus parietis]